MNSVVIDLYVDEFNIHKQLNTVILGEVMRRIPGVDEDGDLNEQRSLLFDTLFDEVAVALANFLAADLKKALFITFNPTVTITTGEV